MKANEHRWYELLKNNQGKIFRLIFSDGALVIAKILHVDDEYKDFVYDIIPSPNSDSNRTKDGNVYRASFSELESAELNL